jgi:molybdate transport system permease protein
MALNPAHRRMSKPLNQLWKLLALPLLLYIALPLAALIFKVSLSDLLASLSEPQVRQAITLSMVTSFITTLIALLLGTPVAYLLAQRKSNFTRFADTLIDLPTVLPPSVAGGALLMAFGRRGLLGPGLSSMGIEIPFTLVAVIMA